MKKHFIALLIGLFIIASCEKDDAVKEPHVAEPTSQKILNYADI